MALDLIDIELMESFSFPEGKVALAAREVRPVVVESEPAGSFRPEMEDAQGQALDKEYEDAMAEMDRLKSNTLAVEEEYFEFPHKVRLAGVDQRIKSLKSQWDSLTDKMATQEGILSELRERRRKGGRDLVFHRLQEAMESGEV